MDPLRNSRYMQFIAAFTATLAMANSAIYVTWSSPTLPTLTSDDSPIGTTLTDKEASWVASSKFLGNVVGGLGTSFLVEKCGRRRSLLISAIPLFVPWIMVVYAKSAMVLIIARFIAGLGSAIAMTAAPMYNGEIAEKDIRGKLGLFCNLLMSLGALFVLSLGPFVSYKTLAWSCSAFPVIFFALFYFMPESPYYLIKVGQMESARRNLTRLSSNKDDDKMVIQRLTEIEDTVEFDMQNKSTLAELLTKKEYRKSLIIMIGIGTLQQLAGLNAIDSYMQTIIEDSKSSISPQISSIIFGLMQVLAVLISAALVDRMGRKPLLIVSALGCATALIAEGVYFYLQNVKKANVDYLSWLPTTGLVLYIIMNSIGVYSLPYVLMGELFTTNIKGIAVSAFTVYTAIFAFLSIKFFEPISDAWGIHTMFWIFAAICVLGSIFVFVVLPETKGKTFAEIQMKLNSNKSV